MPSYWDALSDAIEALEDCTESPQLDAELLLRHVTGIDRVALFMCYDHELPETERARFDDLVQQRQHGVPIAYMLGTRWFRMLELHIDPRVLIPRPETERLVEYALTWLKHHPGRRRVIDVGTGSGAIALALASELGDRRPDVEIVGVDVSNAALEVARMNREQLGLTQRVTVLQSDLLSNAPGPYDVILANLPYLRPDQRHHSTQREPEVALFGGPDGFDLHRTLLQQAADALTAGGIYIGEIDPAQAAVAIAFATQTTGRAARVDADYAGDARYLIVGDEDGAEESVAGSEGSAQ